MDLRSSKPVIFVYATDRDRALNFYRATLGLPLQSSDGFGDFIDAGAALIRLTVMPDHVPTAHPCFGWQVDNVSAVVQVLSARGVSLAIYEGMDQDDRGVWTAPDGHTQLAWFRDPDGNVLSLSSG